MPDSPVQWVPLLAIPVLVVVGYLSVLHWSRYLGALTRLHRSRTEPRTALTPSAAARLELRSAEHYQRAYRATWQVVVVLALGLAAALVAS